MKENKKRIGIIETIRGLAALAVCLFHFSVCNVPFEGSTEYFVKVAAYGWLGVESFFVLSGFIIPYALSNADYKLSQFFRFLLRRCVRIEPAYLVSIMLVLILGYLAEKAPGFHGKEFTPGLENILLHIGYLPAHFGYTWLLPVYWSLEAELHYYIIIGLCFTFIWKNNFNLYIGLALGLAASFFIPLNVFRFMPFFIMGIVTCAKKAGKINTVVFYLILAAACIVCLIRGIGWEMPAIGLITALLIMYVEFTTVITDFLGKISFSLYLIHVPVGGKILNILGRYAQSELQVWGAIIVALLVTIIASYIFYRLIEYPSHMLAKRISYKRNEKSTDHITPLPTA